jgi:energy-converting hydrogenase Eha subunit E
MICLGTILLTCMGKVRRQKEVCCLKVHVCALSVSNTFTSSTQLAVLRNILLVGNLLRVRVMLQTVIKLSSIMPRSLLTPIGS